MEEKLLQNLTFILTLKGRKNFTERWLNYMNEFNFFCPIIIADGDKDSKIDEFIKKSNFGNLNITYLKFNDQALSDYYFKLQQSLDKVQTKYVMMCDNDDFVLKSGIIDILSFLKKEKSYISAGSGIINFYIDQKSNVPYGKNFYLDSIYKCHRNQEPINTFNNQIFETFKNFQPNYYNIFEISALKTVIEEIKEINFSDMFVPEFYIQLRILTLGKQMKLTSSIQLLRQLGTSFTNSEHFSDRLIKTDFPNDIRKLAKSIAKHTVKKFVTFDKIILEKQILDNFSNYLTNMFSEYYAKYKFIKLYKIKFILCNFFKFIIELKNSFFLEMHLKKKLASYQFFKKEIMLIDNFLKKN